MEEHVANGDMWQMEKDRKHLVRARASERQHVGRDEVMTPREKIVFAGHADMTMKACGGKRADERTTLQEEYATSLRAAPDGTKFVLARESGYDGYHVVVVSRGEMATEGALARWFSGGRRDCRWTEPGGELTLGGLLEQVQRSFGHAVFPEVVGPKLAVGTGDEATALMISELTDSERHSGGNAEVVRELTQRMLRYQSGTAQEEVKEG